MRDNYKLQLYYKIISLLLMFTLASHDKFLVKDMLNKRSMIYRLHNNLPAAGIKKGTHYDCSHSFKKGTRVYAWGNGMGNCGEMERKL